MERRGGGGLWEGVNYGRRKERCAPQCLNTEYKNKS